MIGHDKGESSGSVIADCRSIGLGLLVSLLGAVIILGLAGCGAGTVAPVDTEATRAALREEVVATMTGEAAASPVSAALTATSTPGGAGTLLPQPTGRPAATTATPTATAERPAINYAAAERWRSPAPTTKPSSASPAGMPVS